MAWLRVDDGFAEHRKIDGLSDRAFRIHVSALCLCARKLTDGHVDNRDVRSILARVGGTKRHLNELESAQIWVSNGSGYVIRDYLDYNPSAEQVREERKRAAERMRALRSGERAPERSGERTGERSGVRSGTPSRPLPQPLEEGDLAMNHSFLPSEARDAAERTEGRNITTGDFPILKDVDAA